MSQWYLLGFFTNPHENENLPNGSLSGDPLDGEHAQIRVRVEKRTGS